MGSYLTKDARRLRYTALVTTPGALALLLLLGAYPMLAAVPHDVGSIRLAGLSLEWWYAGVIAPGLALGIVAVSATARGSSPRE